MKRDDIIAGLLLALATAAAPTASAHANLLTNPDFEQEGGWWSGFDGEGGAWRWTDNGQARSGRNAAAIGCGRGTLGGTGYWGQTISRVMPGQQLDFSVWMKTETGFQGRVWLMAEFQDRAGKTILTNTSEIVSGEQLEYIRLNMRTEPGPPETSKLALQVRVGGNRNSAIFDDAIARYVTHPDITLGAPVSEEELVAWRERNAELRAPRWGMQKLENGGWMVTLPDGTPFVPIGVDYEPLALYDGMDWPAVARDMNLIREAGFNTLTVWCMGFHCVTCTTRHLTLEEMVQLTELARDRDLYIQFYLNIDRFTDLFPRAGLADGSRHHFDIDYADPGYREFCRNYARRIAMALYPYDNAVTIVVWEEKIGIDVDFDPPKPKVLALYASEAGKAGFESWLKKRHGRLRRLNAAWGTAYSSFREAVDRSLSDYLSGVAKDDHRQFDILEYGEVFLIDFTREFIEAYKEIDPAMRFQCRHFDLFGPVKPLHPDLAFLDSFGINNYTLGHRGPDFSFREEFIKAKLVAGIAGTAAYVGNFGFRAESQDGATHGLVSTEEMRAHFGADAVRAYNFIPEITGSSYFMYLYGGWEGPWGIVRGPDRERTQLFHALRAAHSLMAESMRDIARADYVTPPRIHIFHGLDAIFDLKPVGWIQQPELSFDLVEMDLNYGVITDTDPFDPSERPVIFALSSAYDRKLDTRVLESLAEYVRRGGTLVIGNAFGTADRYLRKSQTNGKMARRLRGMDIGPVRRGDVRVRGAEMPDTLVEDTFYVEPDMATLDEDAEVLLMLEVGEKEQPALIRRPYGKGTVYFLLFNPFRQEIWTGVPGKENRASLPVVAFLCRQLGIAVDDRLGNQGVELKNGRINIHEKLVHAFVSRELFAEGKYEDEYGETGEIYSGGVITDDFLSFRGRRLEERGWSVEMPAVTSMGAGIASNTLSFFTLDATTLKIRKGPWNIRQKTEPFKIYRVSQPVDVED